MRQVSNALAVIRLVVDEFIYLFIPIATLYKVQKQLTI